MLKNNKLKNKSLSIKKNIIKGLFTFLILQSAFLITTPPALVFAGFDESKPYNIDDVVEQYEDDHIIANSTMYTLDAYINKSTNYWRFGDNFADYHYGNGEIRRALTLQPQWCYNRISNTWGKFEHKQNAGDVVFTAGGKNNAKGYDNSAYICSKVRGEVGSDVGGGMHIYSYTPAEGTTLIFEKWSNRGLYATTHEPTVEAQQKAYEKGIYKLISGYGRWVNAFGIEFHSSLEVAMRPGERESNCYNPNATSMSDYFYNNSTAWIPVCAVCGEWAIEAFHYTPMGAVQELPIGETGTWLVTTCPFCGGLEQGAIVRHTCKGLSTNKLKVNYDINTTNPDAYGYVPSSVFLYHGGTEYEAKNIKVATKVPNGDYVNPGYTFAGWSTSSTATTPTYYANQDILTLKSAFGTNPVDGATITLYAVWKPNTTNLKIQFENTYNGTAKYENSTAWSKTLTYPASYTLNTSSIALPNGNMATFNGNGGTVYEGSTSKGTSYSKYATTYIAGSRMSTNNTNATYDTNSYLYKMGTDIGNDIITISFAQNEITLPSAEKSGALFIGWFTKADGSANSYVGTTGDSYLVSQNKITLYAVFSTLDFEVIPTFYTNNTTNPTHTNAIKNNEYHKVNSAYIPGSNYAVHNATGASTLHMQMITNSSVPITYKPYCKLNGTSTWKLLTSSEGINQSAPTSVSQTYKKGAHTYTIPYTGIYQINAIGAQGGNHGSYVGGKGGLTSGYFFLNKGDVLTVTVGGQDGYNGGGTATDFGNGGGYTSVVLNNTTTLLISGGGGGATDRANGNNGGATTNLVEGSTGESGMAGGGGGYQGGKAGISIVHEHDKDTCGYHRHIGDSVYGGECYSLDTTVNNVCGTYYKTPSHVWCGTCGDATGEYYVGVGAHLYGDYASHNFNVIYKVMCDGCYAESTDLSLEGTKHIVTGYSLTCGKINGYQCGKKGYAIDPAWSTAYYLWRFATYTDTHSSGGIHTVSQSEVLANELGTSGFGIALGGNATAQSSSISLTNSDKVKFHIHANGGDNVLPGVTLYDADTNKVIYTCDLRELIKNGYKETKEEFTIGCGNRCDDVTRYTWTHSYTDANGVETSGTKIFYSKHSCQVDGNWSGAPSSAVYDIDFMVPIPSNVRNVSVKVSITHQSNNESNWIGIDLTNFSFLDLGGGSTAESSKPGNGGSNFVHSSAYTGSAVNTATTATGDGQVAINSKVLDGLIGNINHKDIFGAYTPDTKAPDAIENPHYNLKSGLLTWETPNSNGTFYDYYVGLYSWDSASLTMKSSMNSPVITEEIESAIAGYYIIFDNNASTNVSSCIKTTANFNPKYTWTNQYLTISPSNMKVMFVAEGSAAKHSINLKQNSNGYKYAHIAAVDVAGNIGLATSFSTNDSPSSSIAPVIKIIFDTNHLSKQLNPTSTISYNTWSASCTNGTIGASGKNKPGYFYYGYWSYYDSTYTGTNGKFNTSITNLKYGGVFPVPTANGCTFLGWNTRADGSGTYYSYNGNDYVSGYDCQKLEPYVLYNDSSNNIDEYNHTLRLYAIWKENNGSSSISATYKKPISSSVENIRKSNGQIYTTFSDVAITSGTTPWTTEASVTVNAQISATGVENIKHNFKSASVSAYSYLKYGMAGNTAVKQQVFKIANVEKVNSGDYTNQMVSLTVDYQLQGAFNVYGSANSVEKEFGGVNPGTIPNTNAITIKLDKTSPVINSCSVTRKSLSDINIENLTSTIQNGIKTTFVIEASDYLNSENGVYYNQKDASGIKAVYLTVANVKDAADRKTFLVPLKTVSETTLRDSNVIKGVYEVSIDLYAEFPAAATLTYNISAVDNAGNVSEVSYGSNMIQNFDIRTAIYNDEDNIYNLDANTGDIYLLPGSKARVEVWTVGYVNSVQFDFKKMGAEAVREITEGLIHADYNMGILNNSAYARELPCTVATPINPTSFNVVNASTGTIETVTAQSNATRYQALCSNNGVPYAAHYKTGGWNNSGTSVMIPPYYPRTKDGDKVNDDGTPQYKWERHLYEVIGKKGLLTKNAGNSYILWDAISFDVHYRVIHQEKNYD